MTLRATKARILAVPAEQPVTPGGLHIAPAYRLPASHGRVVSVGPQQLDVRPGTMVSWKPFEGQVLWHGDDEYRLLEPEHILLIDL